MGEYPTPVRVILLILLVEYTYRSTLMPPMSLDSYSAIIKSGLYEESCDFLRFALVHKRQIISSILELFT